MIESAALRLVLRVALCAALSWGVWRLLGLAPMVATAPLWGIALAKPLVDLVSEARHHMRTSRSHLAPPLLRLSTS